MALSNAARQSRFREKRKADQAKNEVVILLEQAIAYAIEAIWTISARVGDHERLMSFDAFRIEMAPASGRDLADLIRRYLPDADRQERPKLQLGLRMIEDVLRNAGV